MPQAALCAAALLGLMLHATTVAAKDLSAQAESCTQKSWGFLTFNDHKFGTVNECDYPVTVWFMRPTGDVMHADVLPGGYFDSGFTSAEFNDANWAFATCRVGRSPSVPVDMAHWDQILNSQYTCTAN